MYLLVLNLHPLSLGSKARLTSYSIRRLWHVNISSCYCPGNGSGHTLWLTYKRTIITNVTLKHMYSQGSSHYPPPPSTTVLQKPVTIPKNTLTNLTETSTRRKTDQRTKNKPRLPASEVGDPSVHTKQSGRGCATLTVWGWHSRDRCNLCLIGQALMVAFSWMFMCGGRRACW